MKSITNPSIWNKYFYSRSKDLASGTDITQPLIYGTEVYASPSQRKFDQTKGTCFIRWLVMEWQGEFNVFLEKLSNSSKKNKTMVASFNIKEKAIKFALEMCLICNGRLNRKKTIFD